MKLKFYVLPFSVFSMQAQEASKTSKTVVKAAVLRRRYLLYTTNKGDITVVRNI
jgi:hypothetical protein